MRRSTTLLGFLLALISLWLGTSTERPLEAQGANLVNNPGFEQGVYTFDPDDYPWLAFYATQREDCKTGDGEYLPCSTAQTPLGWLPWWISQVEGDPGWKNRMPEYKPAEAPFLNRVRSGSRAAQYFTFHGTHTAGLLQIITVPTNAAVRFSIWGQAWSSASDATYSDFPTPVNMRIGIDPTGSSNMYNPAIVWSEVQQPYDAYSLFTVEAQAQGDRVTIFTYSAPVEARKHNDIYWDDAELVLTDGSSLPPPPPAGDGGTGDTGSGGGETIVVAPVPGSPTSTPDAEGVIYAQVLSGDSWWSLAARNGLTLDEIYSLNSSEESTVLRTGELVVVGFGDPPAPEEEELAAEGEAAAEAGAEEETEAEPTATPAPTATPEPTKTGGEICLKAFDDANQNGRHDEAEGLRAAVAFTIASPSEVVANYVTDGVSEPYCITGLPAGNYQITRSIAPNENLTTSGDWAISLSDGGVLNFEFGSFIAEAEVVAASLTEDTSGSSAAAASAADALTAPDPESGPGRVILIAAVGIAVVLLVAVVVVVLSARRTAV